MLEALKPTRKITSSKSSLRGKIFSKKNNVSHDFESSLERDFIEILEFEPNVTSYIEQPITIPYLENDLARTYTPDFLINYRQSEQSFCGKIPLLVEIKYSEDLIKNGIILEPKFSAAQKYVVSKGWDFKVLTENEIRNDYLKNVKFLSSYKEAKYVMDDDFLLLLNKISALRVTTPQELILASARTETKRLELLHALWYMITNNYIACDLNNLLTMKSEIWATQYI